MARTDTLDNFLTDVADAIRTKKGTEETILASDFDTEIENLPSGGGDYNVKVDTTETYNYMGRIGSLITEIGEIDTSNMTMMASMFSQCSNLVTVPHLDTSNNTNMNSMFYGCTNLVTIPQLDASSVTGTNMSSMFSGCTHLSWESINNILAMCASATNYTGMKTLYFIFGSSNMASYYPASTIETLSNYQDFINAGWTISW